MQDVAIDREAERLRAAVRALIGRFSVSERADVACCGMTVAQAAALQALRSAGTLRPGTLGRHLGIRPSTMTRNLSRLEERGLVARVADPVDGRACCVRLTVAGRRAAVVVEEKELAFARSVLKRLPRSRRTRVREALETLVTAVRAATESCCAGAFDPLTGEAVSKMKQARSKP